MTTPRNTEVAETPLAQNLIQAARYYLRNRRALLILAGLAIAAGLALNWSWLAAAGIAPILISVVPCLAMCAFGLCMNRAGSKSCSIAANPSDPAAVDSAEPAAQAVALDAPPNPAAPEPSISGDAAIRISPELHPSQERRLTDA